MKITRKNNFDLVRLLAALIVVIAHTADVSKYAVFETLSGTFNSRLAVDIFFVISGFLIIRSYENSSNLGVYLKKRMKRILPAYAAVIIITAVALSLISTVSFDKYFNLEFAKYIVFNLLTFNFLQPTLPGVFVTNDIQVVNLSLWTIKVEVMFYLLVPLIVYVLSKTNKILTLGLIYLGSILYSTALMQFGDRFFEPDTLIQLEQQLPGQLAFFISGAFIYYFYDKFRDNILFLLPIAAFVIAIHNFAAEIYLMYPLALATMVIYFCLIFRYLGNFSQHGDFSYGIYIWHFPILQIFAHFRLFERPALAVPTMLLCIFFASYASWNLIEKPFLARRSRSHASSLS